MTSENKAEFAGIIKQQIGVGTLMTVGARDFLYTNTDTERSLQFKVTGKRGYHTGIKVVLEPSDTYTVELNRMHKRTYEFEQLQSVSYVFAEDLAGVVRKLSGE